AIRLTTDDAPLAHDVSVNISDLGTGSATSGADYNAFRGSTATFLTTDTPNTTTPGVSRVFEKTFSLGIIDDLRVEANETIDFQLSNLSISAPDMISLGAQTTHTLTITDNDSATVSTDAGTTNVKEGDPSQNVTATLHLVTSGSGVQELAVDV